MIFLTLTSLIVSVPFLSAKMISEQFIRMTVISIIFALILSINSIFLNITDSGIGIFCGSINITSITSSFDTIILLFSLFVLCGFSKGKGFKQSNSEYIPIISETGLVMLLTLSGALLLISSSDLITIYLSVELQSFGVYLIASLYRDSFSSTSAGLKYFMLGALSSAFILLGAGFVYAYIGTTNFEYIIPILATTLKYSGTETYMDGYQNIYNHPEVGVSLGLFFITIGFLFKVAAAPFHQWAPDVYDGVSTKFTIWLTVIPKISVIVFIFTLASFSYLIDFSALPLSGYGLPSYGIQTHINVFGQSYTIIVINSWQGLLLISSILCLVLGTVLGLSQIKIKRLLAYSTISHVGFIIFCLAINSAESTKALFFYIIQYSIANINTFLVLICFGITIVYDRKSQYGLINTNKKIEGSQGMEVENINNKEENLSVISRLEYYKVSDDLENTTDLKGFFYKNPTLSITFTLCMFSLAGIPPLIGFFGKYFVLYSAILKGYFFLAIVCILTSVISASYYLKLISYTNFYKEDIIDIDMEENSSTGVDHNGEVSYLLPSTFTYIIAVLTFTIVFFIFNGASFLNMIDVLSISYFYV